VNSVVTDPLKRPAKTGGKKGKVTQLLEYAGVSLLLLFSQAIPLTIIRMVSSFLGKLFFLLVAKRRIIAMENLRNAFATEKGEKELRVIAQKSFTSFFLTFLEMAKFRHLFSGDHVFANMKKLSSQDLEQLFQKAKRLHDESKGCIFVTPHIGNWELLPQVSAVVGIPLVVLVRPLDNFYLEQLIYKNRSDSGQIIIPKKNALFALQKTLQQGRSIGMLPDQATMHGISVDFFGHKATTTPVPAMLSIMYRRPIVVVACCRKSSTYRFEGIVSEPIYPVGEYTSEKEEIFRLTGEMNKRMEAVIRSYPDQYLWMHNRWKTYKNKTKKGMLA